MNKIEEIVRNSKLTGDELSKLQDQRLCEIVRFAYDNVPFYRKKYDSHNVTPEMIQGVKDIEKLPLVTKDELRKAPVQDIIPVGSSPKDFVVLRTSGSTGVPLAIYRDLESIQRILDLNMWQYYQWWNGFPQGNGLYILSLSETSLERVLLDKLPIEQDRILDVKLSSKVHYQYLKRYHPTYLSAYPSILRNLGMLLLQRGEQAEYVYLIHSTAELLDLPTRELVVKTFPNALVVETYGSHEGGLMAFQCNKSKGLHIFTDNLVMEPLKEEPGQGWTTAITDLTNKGTPIIRYTGLGDLIVFGDEQECSCGLTYPMIERINGRVIDSIILPDGSGICPFAITLILKEIEGLYRFQLIQNNLEEIEIYVVPFSDDEKERLLTEIPYKLEQTIARELKFKIIFVDEIKPKKAGSHKIPVVICNIDTNNIVADKNEVEEIVIPEEIIKHGSLFKALRWFSQSNIKNLRYDFLDSLFRGIGQIFLCNNPISGLFFIIALSMILPARVIVLSLICLMVSTAFSYLVAPRYWLVKHGVAGANGMFIGLALDYFPEIPFSEALLYGIACSIGVSLFINLWFSYFTHSGNSQALCFPFLFSIFMLCTLFFTTHVDSHNALRGWELYRCGHYNDSKTAFLKAQKTTPRAWTSLGLGWSLFREKQFWKASEEFKNASMIKPDFEKAHTGIGWSKMKLELLIEADAHFEKAITINSDDSDAWIGKGWLSYMICDYENALSRFRNGMRSWRTIILGYVGMGCCYARSANPEKANEMFQMARIFAFDSDDINKNIAFQSLEKLSYKVSEKQKKKWKAFSTEVLFLFKRFCINPIMAFSLLFIGILIYSKISLFSAVFGILFSIVVVFLFPQCPEFRHPLFFYHSMAVSIAFLSFLFETSPASFVWNFFAMTFHSAVWYLLCSIGLFQGFPQICISFAIVVLVMGFSVRSFLPTEGRYGLKSVNIDLLGVNPDQINEIMKQYWISSDYWKTIRNLSDPFPDQDHPV